MLEGVAGGKGACFVTNAPAVKDGVGTGEATWRLSCPGWVMGAWFERRPGGLTFAGLDVTGGSS